MIGIIGSGFGLYGHFPAATILSNQTILLPKRYKSKLERRTELAHLSNRISWQKEDDEILKKANCVVLSVRPVDQVNLIKKCFENPNIKNLILEKPLALTPILSDAILKELLSSKINFRITYSFIYTNWFNELCKHIKNKHLDLNVIKINWSFLANHYDLNLNNWKRFNSMGGSVIRFYGVHIIALLSALGFKDVEYSNTFGISEDDNFRWNVKFTCEKGRSCEVIIDSMSKVNDFQIQMYNKTQKDSVHSIKLLDPFSDTEPLVRGLDARIEVVMNVHRSLMNREGDEFYYDLYQTTNQLWLEVENKNVYSNHNLAQN